MDPSASSPSASAPAWMCRESQDGDPPSPPALGPMLSFSRMCMQAIVLEAAAMCAHNFSTQHGMNFSKVSIISIKSFFLNFRHLKAVSWLKTTG